MKKLILAIVILFSVDTQAQVQPRYCDLRAEFTEPKTGDLIQSPTVIHFTFKLVNQGPDSMYANDSIKWRPAHAYVPTQADRYKAIGKIIIPGDSFYISDTVSINGREDIDNFQLRVKPLAIGRQKVRPLQSEFTDDVQKDNIAVVYVVHRKPKTGGVEALMENDLFTLYPNPITQSSFTLKSEFIGSISMQMMDCVGREIYKTDFKKTSLEQLVPLPKIINGVYFVTLSSENNVWTQKVIIQE
ncbi:MAG: hypothetical protein RLZZ337_626 [Bacteroidota bacterium]|jgi:hypothetical protein